MAHLKARESRHIAYRKTYMEWETFGDLALRLEHLVIIFYTYHLLFIIY